MTDPSQPAREAAAKPIRVIEHLPNGKTRKRTRKREHVCTKKCLRVARSLGRKFYYCARYSYAGAST